MLDDFWVAAGGRSLQVSLSLTDRSRSGDPKKPPGNQSIPHSIWSMPCCACGVAILHPEYD